MGASSSSSYKIRDDGTIQPLSELVPVDQRAICWNVFIGEDVYSVNTLSSSVDSDGFLTLSSTVSGEANARDGNLNLPIDVAVSVDEKFLYVVNVAVGSISAFEVGGLEDGGLRFVDSVSEGLPRLVVDTMEGVLGLAVI